MKKCLLIINFIITGIISSRADIFLIEGQEDITRVANTFIYFYNQNKEKLTELKNCKFDKTSCKKFIVNFKALHPENPLCHIEKNKQTLKSCILLGQYLYANSGSIKESIGEKSYNAFSWGVFYVFSLLKALAQK